MFCKKCGAENSEGATFCKACGSPIATKVFTQDVVSSISPSSPNLAKKKSLKRILYIAGTIIAIALILMVISESKSPVNNVKELIFEEYTDQKIGTTTEQVFKYSPKWKYEKISSDYYQVTVSGFFEELNMNIDAVFDYNDYGDYFYANLKYVVINGQTYNDNLSLRTVMAILCNNLDMADRLLTQSFLSSLLGW